MGIKKQWEMGNQCIAAAVRVIWSHMKERVNDRVD